MSYNALIDQNDKPTILAYNETTGTVETAYVDPVTNALLVFAVSADSNVPTAINVAKIDANDNPTLLAYNETTGNVEAVRCSINGEILMKA